MDKGIGDKYSSNIGYIIDKGETIEIQDNREDSTIYTWRVGEYTRYT